MKRFETPKPQQFLLPVTSSPSVLSLGLAGTSVFSPHSRPSSNLGDGWTGGKIEKGGRNILDPLVSQDPVPSLEPQRPSEMVGGNGTRPLAVRTMGAENPPPHLGTPLLLHVVPRF